jgi:hypothetical protein
MTQFILYNVIFGFLLNWLIAPIAYLFRKPAQKHKGFLWWFLSDDNMYGDTNWRPNLKNKFLRAYFWMLRNPLQNHYWKDYVEGTESGFSGTGKVKFDLDILRWRTVICSDTGDWHGKVINFEKSPLGRQNITFIRTDKDGNIQNCYRKSTCIPHKFLCLIIVVKRRAGHENGLLQYNFTFPVFKYSLNKEGFENWKKAKWKNIVI